MSKRRPSVASTTSPPAVLSPARSFSGALGLALTSPTHERASGPLSPPLLSPRAGHDIKPALVRSETSQSDVAKHDPDDLFRRLTVGEVKRVEARLRSSALSKQSELRSMVGERYRDLLSSSAALATLHSSSAKLSAGLSHMKRVSSSVGDSAAASGAKPSGSSVESDAGDDNLAEELGNLLPLASQTKLLLDAPETLWRFLEHHQFLQAAWLFCLGRVVHQEVGESARDEIQLPLLQRQWESLSQFRSQIVQRATIGLRSLSHTASETTQTLIAIILLDSISLPASLSLLLNQRTRLLRDSAQSSVPALVPDKVPHSQTATAQPSGTASPIAGGRGAKAPAEILEDIVTSLCATVVQARAIFGAMGEAGSDSPSLIELTMQGIERGEVEPSTPTITAGERPPSMPEHAFSEDSISDLPPTPSKQTSSERMHKRRASRLKSISLPFSLPPHSILSPKPSSSSPTASAAEVSSHQIAPPILSTPALLRTLPSSPLLLRYLPQPVKSYTPFLSSASSQPLHLAGTLSSWLESNSSFLRSALHDLAARLMTVARVWETRADVERALLAVDGLEAGERDKIRAILEAGWEKRIGEIWAVQLLELRDRLGVSLQSALDHIQANAKDAYGDVVPSAFLFSPSIPFPISSSSVPPSSSLPTFRTALRKRVAARTPLLDTVLREAESHSAALRTDVDILRHAVSDATAERLLQTYQPLAREALEGVVLDLKEVLASQAKSEAAAVKSEIFIGRVAHHLLLSKTFETDVLGPAQTSETWRSGLKATHATSLNRWRTSAVDAAVACLDPLFKTDPRLVEASQAYLWKPAPSDASILLPTRSSTAVHLSLHSLASSLQSLGPPPYTDTSHLGKALYAEYAERVVNLPAWSSSTTIEGKAVIQTILDMSFLQKLSAVSSGKAAEAEKIWNSLLETLVSKAPKALRSTLPSLVAAPIAAELLRVQTILSPLLGTSSPSLPPVPIRKTSALGPTNPSTETTVGATPSMTGTDTRHLSLLWLGVPKQEVEMGEALAVVSPSQRFGLLSVTMPVR